MIIKSGLLSSATGAFYNLRFTAAERGVAVTWLWVDFTLRRALTGRSAPPASARPRKQADPGEGKARGARAHLRGSPPASLEALHSSQSPRGWAEGVPRARPAFPVTSLCTNATHRILMCCLSDTHQSDVRTAAPRELLSAGKQVTGLLPPQGCTCHLPSRLLPAPGTCLALWGVGTPSRPPGRGLLPSVLAGTHLLCFLCRVSSCGAHKEPHCSPQPGTALLQMRTLAPRRAQACRRAGSFRLQQGTSRQGLWGCGEQAARNLPDHTTRSSHSYRCGSGLASRTRPRLAQHVWEVSLRA